MRHTGFIARGIDGGDDAFERLGLRVGLLFVAERGVQVRIDAGDGDVVHIGVDGQELVNLGGQKAVASHAGVNFDVRVGNDVFLRGHAVEHRGVVLTGDGDDGVQVEKLTQLVARARGAEHENLFFFKARLAQRAHVRYLGDGKARDARLAADGGHGDKSQTVAVSLEHRPDGRAVGALDEIGKIFSQVGGIDKIGFHMRTSRTNYFPLFLIR